MTITGDIIARMRADGRISDVDAQVDAVHSAARRMIAAERNDGEPVVPGLTVEQAALLAWAALNGGRIEALLREKGPLTHREIEAELRRRTGPIMPADPPEMLNMLLLSHIAALVRIVEGKVYIEAHAGEVVYRAMREALS